MAGFGLHSADTLQEKESLRTVSSPYYRPCWQTRIDKKSIPLNGMFVYFIMYFFLSETIHLQILVLSWGMWSCRSWQGILHAFLKCEDEHQLEKAATEVTRYVHVDVLLVTLLVKSSLMWVVKNGVWPAWGAPAAHSFLWDFPGCQILRLCYFDVSCLWLRSILCSGLPERRFPGEGCSLNFCRTREFIGLVALFGNWDYRQVACMNYSRMKTKGLLNRPPLRSSAL